MVAKNQPQKKSASAKSVSSAQVTTPVVSKTEEIAGTLSIKNYRTNPDMENFFRFIFENDLRLEALQIIDELLTESQPKQKKVSLTQ